MGISMAAQWSVSRISVQEVTGLDLEKLTVNKIESL